MLDRPIRTPEDALAAVFSCFDNNKSALAAQLNITPQAVDQWTTVPAKRVLLIESLIGARVTRYQMCPEVFGPAPGVAATKASQQTGRKPARAAGAHG